MLRNISILNYQSHEDTQLELSPGINVIIGQTNTGKTAILRALNWLINNRPTGDGFKCNKNEKNEIRVFLANDEWNLARIKNFDKDFNGYFLQNRKDSKERFDFNKIGVDVPEKIKRVLNLSFINYQSQLSKHFLITESPGEVGRVINDCTRMVDIDRVMQWFEKELREKRSQDKFIEKDLEGKKEEVKQYEGIESVGNKIERILDLESQTAPIEDSLTKMSGLQTRWDRLYKDKKEIDGWLDTEEGVRKLSRLIGDLKNKRDRLNKLVFGMGELHKKQEVFKRLDEELERVVIDIGKRKSDFIQELINQGYCPFCRGKIDKDKAELLLRGEKN